MPSTFAALAVFAGAVVPGYVFLSGYQFQRTSTRPDHDLYVLAQAFVASAAWIAITWWPIGHLLSRWVVDDQVGSHEFLTWCFACLLLTVPYVSGRASGSLIEYVEARESGWLHSLMLRLGMFEPPTLWDWTWKEVASRGPVVMVIRLKDGSSIEGQFAGQSRADFSPRSPRVYLERAYGFDDAGGRIVYPRGAYVEGDQISGVQFKN